MRIGLGYDLHRLGAERPLRLGGVEIRGAPGLHGHSDADCVLHAVADALLGAASLGDIGQHFPDKDPALKDADSQELLATIVRRISAVGYVASNADCTIVAEKPTLGPYREAMRKVIATTLALPPDRVGVKFTTNEGVGAVGRGEAIACHAVVLIERRKR